MSESITWRGEPNSSSNLVEAEYVLSDRTFRVKFKDGAEVTYGSVPLEYATSFLTAVDKNRYYLQKIKPFYKPVMNEAEYTRGQEAIRLLTQFREFQRNNNDISWDKEGDTFGLTIEQDKIWVPAVNEVLDRK